MNDVQDPPKLDILEQRLKPSPDVLANAVGNETVLLQVKRGNYHGLDEIGTSIWEGIRTGVPPLEICERIAAEYDQSLESVQEDARAFLEDLKTHGIIVVE
jgi:hypothetical protein